MTDDTTNSAASSPVDGTVRPLLPCPMCGGEKGYTLSSGSTFRWLAVACADCGRDIGECRADPNARYTDPLPVRWAGADDEWNEAAAHAHALRNALTPLANACFPGAPELTDADIEAAQRALGWFDGPEPTYGNEIV